MVRWLLPGEAAKRLGLSRSGTLWLADTRRLRMTRTDTGVRLLSARDVERLRAEREEQAEKSGKRLGTN